MLPIDIDKILIFVAFGFAGIFFVIGIIFVLKGFRSDPEEHQAVPISDYEEIQEINEDILIKTESTKQSESYDETKAETAIQLDENDQINVGNHEAELNSLKEESDNQAQDAQEKIDKLIKENQELKEVQKNLEGLASKNTQIQKEMDDKAGKTHELELSVSDLKKEREQILQQGHLKVKEFEEKIQKIENDKEKYLNDRNLLEKLRKENVELTAQINRDKNKITEFEDQLGRCKGESEKDVVKAKETIDSLNSQQTQMHEKQRELELNVKKMKKFNAHLIEKEKILQYELTKSRAQSIGLEKICEDFKIQIEDLSKPLEEIGS